MKHADLKEMLGLYALGALGAGDAAQLEVHLESCRTCLEELGDLQDTAAELAYAAAPAAPSLEVTRRTLEAVRSEPRRSAVERVRPLLAAPRGRRWRLLPVAATIAAAAVVVFLVVAQINLLDRLDGALHTLSRGRELLEFIASPDVTTVPFAATESAPAARAFLAYNRRSGRVVLFAFNLPPPPEGKQYQLWLISEGIRPGIVFSPDALGGTLLVDDQWSPEPREGLLFAITLEPSAGGREPTGEIFLLGTTRRSGFGIGR